MRQLLPTALYPGRERVGQSLGKLNYPADVAVFDGVDWYWWPSLRKALRLLRRHRPELTVLQWWSGTVLHTYLVLALATRALGGRVIVEFHELLDTAERDIRAVRYYVKVLAPLLVRSSSGFVVHSEYDRMRLLETYKVGARPVHVIAHGPYDQYNPLAAASADRPLSEEEDACRLLFFGTIRPYKGLEDLIRAFNGLSSAEAHRYRLTVVGETWQGWTLPGDLIARSPHRSRITFINRYVDDGEVGRFFDDADVVVLPYRRSSASGPLHIAMSRGLPVVVTRVGGLVEATEGYAGALLVPPADPDALRAMLPRACALSGQGFQDQHSWERTVQRYDGLFHSVGRLGLGEAFGSVRTSEGDSQLHVRHEGTE
jgi:glycosyltransferase involved in cell wall biosynthesis